MTSEKQATVKLEGSLGVYGLSMVAIGAAVILLRRKRKGLVRPYKTLGYPATLLIFVLISFFFLVNTLLYLPAQAYAAIACLLLGLPFYFYFYFKRRRGAA